MAGRVRYDRGVTEAQVRALAVVECPGAASAPDIRQLWEDVRKHLTRPAGAPQRAAGAAAASQATRKPTS